jgi:hypothetical protein
LKIFLQSRHDARVNRFLLVFTFLWLRVITVYAEDERIWWPNVKVNGQPVRIAFDTGSDSPILLFSATAERLGLKVLPPDLSYHLKLGEVRESLTEVCSLDIGTTNLKTAVKVIEIPTYFHGLDGIFGWSLIRQNVLQIDAVKDTAEFIQEVPDDPDSTKFELLTNSDYLELVIQDKNGAKAIIFIDTGSPDGLKLTPSIWREWKETHTNQPTTLNAYYTPAMGLGLVVKEEAWAKKISLGPLTLTDVPITEADSADIALGSIPNGRYEATLGLAALKRLDSIIDGKHGIAYLRAKKTPPLPYEHNRLGAVFVPRDSQNDDLVAHVVDGSPAFEAGIRNDDVLLKIGKLDATKWRSDPNVLPLSRFWNSPAGTKLELTLKRGDKVFKTTAVLRNILPPDAPKKPN